MEKTLVREIPIDPFSHGKNGLGGVEFPLPTTSLYPKSGPELIVEKVNEFPNELTIIMQGPLTNLAMAMMIDPSIVKIMFDYIKVLFIVFNRSETPNG